MRKWAIAWKVYYFTRSILYIKLQWTLKQGSREGCPDSNSNSGPPLLQCAIICGVILRLNNWLGVWNHYFPKELFTYQYVPIPIRATINQHPLFQFSRRSKLLQYLQWYSEKIVQQTNNVQCTHPSFQSKAPWQLKSITLKHKSKMFWRGAFNLKNLDWWRWHISVDTCVQSRPVSGATKVQVQAQWRHPTDRHLPHVTILLLECHQTSRFPLTMSHIGAD